MVFFASSGNIFRKCKLGYFLPLTSPFPFRTTRASVRRRACTARTSVAQEWWEDYYPSTPWQNAPNARSPASTAEKSLSTTPSRWVTRHSEPLHPNHSVLWLRLWRPSAVVLHLYNRKRDTNSVCLLTFLCARPTPGVNGTVAAQWWIKRVLRLHRVGWQWACDYINAGFHSRF